MQDQFNQGEKEAKVHMLPPNMEVQELNNIDHGRELQFFQEDFLVAVYAFFDLPRVQDIYARYQRRPAGETAVGDQQGLLPWGGDLPDEAQPFVAAVEDDLAQRGAIHRLPGRWAARLHHSCDDARRSRMRP